MNSYYYGLTYFIFFILFILMFLVERTPDINVSFYYKTKNKYFSYYSLFLIFFVFIGLRGFVNTDWVSYRMMFNEIDPNVFKLKNQFNIEWGFAFLLRFVKLFTKKYEFFVLISALIDFILFYYAFKDQKSIMMCFLFFYIFSGGGAGFRSEFNLQRNIKSILLFCISIKYLKTSNFPKYLILNLVGSLFHITSIIYIPMYIILRGKKSIKLLYVLFILGNILFIFQIQWLSPIVQLLGSFLPGRLGQLVEVYMNSKIYSISFGFSVGYFERFITFFIVIIFYKKYNNENIVYFNILFIYLFIFLYFSEITIFLSRFSLLFIVGYWYVFPCIYFNLNKKNKKIFLTFFMSYAFLKLVFMPNNIIVKYDNVILPHATYSERLYNLNKFSRENYH